jgi:hypothetical protein
MVHLFFACTIDVDYAENENIRLRTGRKVLTFDPSLHQKYGKREEQPNGIGVNKKMEIRNGRRNSYRSRRMYWL